MRYSQTRHQIIVELTNGCSFIFPADKAQGLAGESNKDLAAVSILGKGSRLHQEKLDADLSIASLVVGIFGSQTWMREIARRGGAATTPAKSAAARANGAKGSRPKKNVDTQKAALMCHLVKMPANRRSSSIT